MNFYHTQALLLGGVTAILISWLGHPAPTDPPWVLRLMTFGAGVGAAQTVYYAVRAATIKP